MKWIEKGGYLPVILPLLLASELGFFDCPGTSFGKQDFEERACCLPDTVHDTSIISLPLQGIL